MRKDSTLYHIQQRNPHYYRYSNKVFYNACVEYSQFNRNALVKHFLMAALEGVGDGAKNTFVDLLTRWVSSLFSSGNIWLHGP
ncbi:hypothetical protein SeMB42_g07410 [Synchytrium endobioticum]|uniref:Uncharacterized protein n=1 Tax=Synchytrium endobioticum TaxID=286115 RepID=A0A507C3H8_9FUNG|nr:hypothetical protein SeMB42_g07410 [Synchytrium endobioticum]